MFQRPRFKQWWLALPSLLLLGNVANAQPGGRALFPWWDNPLTQGMDLTDTQRNQIRAVVKEYRDRLVDARAAVEKAEGDLEDIFSEDTVDQRKGAETIERLANARGELTKQLSQMSLRMRTVLTVQQWQELQRRQGPRGGQGVGKNLRRRPGSGERGSGAPPSGPNNAPPAAGAPPPPPPAKPIAFQIP
jgi:Spy/CpxP family protein refolding chaperone